MIHDYRILVITPYPISNPLHGGQKRAYEFVSRYRNSGADVKCVAVFYEHDYKEFSENDIAVTNKKVIEEIKKFPLFADYIVGEAIYKDQSVKERISKLIIEFSPDIIQIEQVYPYVGLNKVLDAVGYRGKFIFNSHNIESTMKREIVENSNLLSDRGNVKYIAKVDQCESKASQRADVVFAVSEADAKLHKQMGAKKVLVIPNGIATPEPTLQAIEHWKKFKKEHGVDKLVTFVGSAHLPNLVGFEKMVGYDLSFLPQGSRLMIAGSISEYMQAYVTEHPEYESIWSRAQPLGRLSDDNLAGLIQESDILLLPITSGGGSNLKTAEAILSHKKIVATNFSFRSFDVFRGLPNIYFADEQAEYKKLISEALEKPLISLTDAQKELSEQVTWQYRMRDLDTAIEIIVRGRFRYTYHALGRAIKRVLAIS